METEGESFLLLSRASSVGTSELMLRVRDVNC